MKRLTLEEPENKCTEEGVDRVISRIERSFGHMKVDNGHDVCSEKKPEDDGKEGKIFIRKHTFIDKDDKILDFELAES